MIKLPLDKKKEEAGDSKRFYFSEHEHTEAVQNIVNAIYANSGKDVLYALFLAHNAYFSILHHSIKQYENFLAERLFSAEDMYG